MVDGLTLSVIYLLAMVLSVPLAKRLGLGSVLGYLLAGIALGPAVVGVLGHDKGADILHFAEFGVIMMLFLIGLELRPSVLWKLRGPIFGLGGLQVFGTTAALAGLAIAAGVPWQSALAAGMILSLSSTAIVLQTLQEKGALKTTGGEAAFSVLLFQDVAVIPMLALFPLLAPGGREMASAAAASVALPAWLETARVIGAIALVIVSGRYLIQPVFRMVGRSQLRELFTAMALLLVLAITMLMNAVGLSPALGAFLAGVVLAESDYRHQLETDIEPFKGLLLGVFFISVGAGIDFGRVAENPGLVAAVVLSLVVVKALVLLAVARVGRLAKPENLLFALALAQGGEFAFVLLNYARSQQILPEATSQSLTAAVALSMFCAPLLIQSYFRWILPAYAARKPSRDQDTIDEHDNPVIVAGFGRFGQMVVRLLKANGFKTTVLDFDVDQIEMVRRFGNKAFYGDASRMDLLHSAGARQARLLILAIDDKEKTTEIVEHVRKEFPNLRILARAYDRIHAYELIHRGVEQPYIETAGSALRMAVDALRTLGVPGKHAVRAGQVFNRHNDRSIRELARVYHESDEASYMAQVKGWLAALEDTLKADIGVFHEEVDAGWESPPRCDEQLCEVYEEPTKP